MVLLIGWTVFAGLGSGTFYEGSNSVGSAATAAGRPVPVIAAATGAAATGTAVALVVEEEARAP